MARGRERRAWNRPGGDLPALSRHTGPLEPRGEYEALEFGDVDLGGQSGDAALFQGCLLRRCRLDGASIAHARVLECLFADCQATRLDAADSTWRDTGLAKGRFGALVAGGSTWTRVRVSGAKLDFVDLSGSQLADVVFEECQIGELDLNAAKVRSLALPGSSIETLDVADAKLARADLSGAALHVLRGVESLRGAIVSRQQLDDLAPLLAGHLGIHVRPS